MKNLSQLSILLFVLFSKNSQAQDCTKGFFASKPNTKMTITYFDEKNKAVSKTEQTIKNIKSTGEGFEADILVNSFDKKDKPVVENASFTVKCEGGVVKMQIHQLYTNQMQAIKGLEMEITGEGLEFPSDIQVGKTLKDASTEVKMKSSNVTLMTMKFDVKNQTIEKKESLTTPAGTFDCYKIVQETDMKILFKKNFKSIMWITQGVGVVRTETYNKKGELEGYSELTKLE